MFIVALFTIAKKWKQCKYPSTDEQINEMCMYTQWNRIQSLKEILSQATILINFEDTMLSEVSYTK